MIFEKIYRVKGFYSIIKYFKKIQEKKYLQGALQRQQNYDNEGHSFFFYGYGEILRFRVEQKHF